jgi:hypothetical protein
MSNFLKSFYISGTLLSFATVGTGYIISYIGSKNKNTKMIKYGKYTINSGLFTGVFTGVFVWVVSLYEHQ